MPLPATVARGPDRHDPGAGVHDEPADLAAHDLGLAEVDARADLEPELADALRDLDGAADRVGGTRERGEEPVACRIELATAMTLQRVSDEAVVRGDERAPPPVPHLARDLGGGDDVGEQHGDELGRHARARHARGIVPHGHLPHKTRVRGRARWRT
jgi:hypothetical protein